ncbi:hypothetical protein EI94DRAFT_1763405, partial [Lactarius quietus]
SVDLKLVVFASRSSIIVPSMLLLLPYTITGSAHRTRTASAQSTPTRSSSTATEPAAIPPPPLLSSLPPLFFSSIPRRMRQASKGV